MTRSDDDQRTIEKVKQIVKDHFPGFASRYFNYNMYLKAPRSLYGYALDLKSFFEFLESIDFTVKSMNLSDLERITPQIIEDYLEYCRTYVKNGVRKEMSLAGLARRYSSLSAFFNYYYSSDLIEKNPVHKIIPPRPFRNKTSIPSNQINYEMLDFIINGDLGGRRNEYRIHTKERDLAIIMLIMGAGIKGSDLVNLNIDDVHLEGKFINVRSRRTTRTVFFSDTIARAVGQYLDIRLDIIARFGDDDALFLSLQGKRMCLRAVQKMIKKYSSAMFDYKDHLTAEAFSLSFRNNVFDASMNINITSAASGNDKYTVLRHYRPFIDRYECTKGTEFSNNSV